jgi:hypothetical protein
VADFVSKLAVGLEGARETHYRLRVLAAAGVHCGIEIDDSSPRRRTETHPRKIIVNTKRNRASSPEMRLDSMNREFQPLIPDSLDGCATLAGWFERLGFPFELCILTRKITSTSASSRSR